MPIHCIRYSFLSIWFWTYDILCTHPFIKHNVVIFVTIDSSGIVFIVLSFPFVVIECSSLPLILYLPGSSPTKGVLNYTVARWGILVYSLQNSWNIRIICSSCILYYYRCVYNTCIIHNYVIILLLSMYFKSSYIIILCMCWVYGLYNNNKIDVLLCQWWDR